MSNTKIENGKRIANGFIRTLADDEIFVFGSNKSGMHGGGAARHAYEHFGAEWGVGEGLTGQCYALPTMEGFESMKNAVDKFTECARLHPELTFLVTAIGCGIAGYSAGEVAPLFKEASKLENVYLPFSFWGKLP